MTTDPNKKIFQNKKMMKKIGKKANLQTLILLIITTPQRKVTAYIMSTLHILRRVQTRDTALTIAECQD